ncbi:unnamed protein product [Ilex paraguariensis]|uniref:Uncharacterized protein n=1 Tax=Ilex paraguariensis TaxID=185542 RepID=A0ABC8S8S4_9AQUA
MNSSLLAYLAKDSDCKQGQTMSEVIAGSDTSTEANTGFDASRIAKVKAWLVSQFDAAGKDVSDFEYTPQSIAHLHNLANISQEKTQAAGIVAKDFCQKASEYHSQAARYPECCCHQNTWFGKKRKALLQDIAILTGVEYQARDLGLLIENTSVEQLGLARKILFTTQKLAEQIAKLSSGVAVIKVGAATENELEDHKLRIEDAKNATFAATEEGIVPSGGAALFHLSTYVPAIKDKLEDADKRHDADIVQKLNCKSSGCGEWERELSVHCFFFVNIFTKASLIAQNAGIEGEVVVEKVKEGEWETGCNAMTDKYDNLVEAGVIDPAKVTRCALQNAASVAGMVLTTQMIVVEKPKSKMPVGAPPQGLAV